jgi:fibrillarin-like pre-rRNA processing protein
MMKIIEHERFAGVYWVELNDGTQKLATVNSAPGAQVYGERLIEIEGVEYRLWDPYRSKLAAAIVKGVKDVPITSSSKVLYLGAASGTTASHVSDLVGPDGVVYCVEISSRPLRDLLLVCNRRPNMVPMLADATKPSSYCSLVDKVDIIYQDVAQPEQSEILLANARTFLRDGGHAMLALKARSIDVTKEPREIFRDEMQKLEQEFEILDTKVLEPYEKDHAMFLMRKGE